MRVHGARVSVNTTNWPICEQRMQALTHLHLHERTKVIERFAAVKFRDASVGYYVKSSGDIRPRKWTV